MAYIEVHHLKDLAERTTGKILLGELVRRLIYASVAKFQPHLHFLSGETNGYPGWDGRVDVTYEERGAALRHRSVWELSTDRDFAAKFKRDYKSAIIKSLPESWPQNEVIYVGMTLRSVTPSALASIKNRLIKQFGNPWAAVVLLAADDVVQWLEKVPSVQDWASDELQIGKGRFGKALEHWFGAWSKQTVPTVEEKLLTSGRDLSALQAAFRVDSSRVTTLQCDSVEEAVALVYCAIQSLNEADKQLVQSSTLVVSDEALADRLADQVLPPTSLPTVILCPPANRHMNRFTLAGYRVIQALGRIDDAPGVIQFERANAHDFAVALHESMGVAADEADTQARAAGSSVSIWHIHNLFKLATQPALPDWTGTAQIDAVAAAVFAGSWNEHSSADIAVLCALAGMEDARLANDLAPFATCTTPLLEQIGSSRMVIAPTAAFEFIRHHITKYHIGRLSRACASVFGTITPLVQDRWQGNSAELYSHAPQREISEGLRDGLAETLLRIAVLGDPLIRSGVLGNHSSAQSYVDSLIRSLPGLCDDARVLASLNRQLPVLMEAAPVPFLEALDTLIQGAPDQLALMLADEPGIFGRSFHTGLLRGLESVAWSPDHLPRVAVILASLDHLDPGGQLSNRPFNSLCEIFLPWHPGTACKPSDRVAILENIFNQFPDVGWRLLVNILPGKRRTSMLTQRPKWRNFGQIDFRSIAKIDVLQAYELNIELTLRKADKSVEKLTNLVEIYPDLTLIHRVKLMGSLLRAPQAVATPAAVQRLRARLHKLCRRHNEFSDASWALPKADIEQLGAIADSLVLEDPVLKHRWMFDEQVPEFANKGETRESLAQRIRKLRQSGLLDIINHSGWTGVQRLIESVVNGHIIGGEVGLLELADSEILQAMDFWQTHPSFSMWWAFRSASAARATIRERSWTDEVLKHARTHAWSPHSVAMAFVDYPDNRKTYEFIRELRDEEQREYWRHRLAYFQGAEDDIEAFRISVEAFLKYDRAVDLIDQNWSDLPKLGSEIVLRVVDAFTVTPLESAKVQSLVTIEHDLRYIFDWLRSQPDVEVEALARREFALLPILTNHGMDGVELSLHQLMRVQPAFFVDAICLVYKPANSEREPIEDFEQAQAQAHAAFALLESWRTPPGTTDSAVDIDAVATWVDSARNLLKTCDRAEVGDQTIGKLLYHMPRDSVDGAHPHQALRELLERWRSDQLEQGFQLESFNSRGVTSRALFEGGRQERNLADLWRTDAAKIEPRWSRAKALCLRIAEMWERDAEREDLSAKKDRARQSR